MTLVKFHVSCVQISIQGQMRRPDELDMALAGDLAAQLTGIDREKICARSIEFLALEGGDITQVSIKCDMIVKIWEMESK